LRPSLTVTSVTVTARPAPTVTGVAVNERTTRSGFAASAAGAHATVISTTPAPSRPNIRGRILAPGNRFLGEHLPILSVQQP
jgi:hypothetical protein